MLERQLPLKFKVSPKFSVIKLLHAQWIVDLYNTLNKEMAINDFRSTAIAEAIENAKNTVGKPYIVCKVENPFKEV